MTDANRSIYKNMDAVRNFRNVGKKIVCVARNYRAHAAELNNPVPKTPVFFMKATTCYVTEPCPIKIPSGCTRFAYEVELAAIISGTAQRVSRVDAMKFVGGYALALDMTARDFQEDAKSAGLPWFLAKSFDGACPVSRNYLPVDALPENGQDTPIWCSINGQIRQNGNTNDMVFDLPSLIERITQHVTLEPGDLLLTGTPEGVGIVKDGDTIECGLGKGDLLKMKFVIEK